jgi:hypothetical protein
MVNDTEKVEALSSDVVAFCALLVRILQRSIAEKNARILALLSLPAMSVVQTDEVTYELAA